MKLSLLYLTTCMFLTGCAYLFPDRQRTTDQWIEQTSFDNPKAITAYWHKVWTGIIDTTSYTKDSLSLFAVLHDSCSGLYCPELYVYTKHTEWELTYQYSFTVEMNRRHLRQSRIRFSPGILTVYNDQDSVLSVYPTERLSLWAE